MAHECNPSTEKADIRDPWRLAGQPVQLSDPRFRKRSCLKSCGGESWGRYLLLTSGFHMYTRIHTCMYRCMHRCAHQYTCKPTNGCNKKRDKNRMLGIRKKRVFHEWRAHLQRILWPQVTIKQVEPFNTELISIKGALCGNDVRVSYCPKEGALGQINHNAQ